MLQRIVHFSLQFRGVVVALACLLLGYGIYVAGRAKLDVFPDFVPPQVVVQAEAPGMASEQVEALVTRPIETAINGLGNMESMRSESIEGLSVVTVVFKDGSDIFLSRQMLAEKLGELAGQLPAGVKSPKMSPLTSSTMDLLKIGLVSEKMSPMELRTFADWTLKPRLLAVAGVARCNLFGGEVRQLQIQVEPDRLLQYDLAISDVLGAARQASGVVGAGFIETANQRIVLQTEGQSITAQALSQVVVAQRNGASIRLRDVARVLEGAERKFGETVIQGETGVLLAFSSQFGANTMEVTRALESALAEMQPVFDKEGIKVHPRLHRPATFIEVALKNIKSSLLLGGVLVAVVLFICLGHVRTALISLTAIPLSLLTAIIVLERFGISLNTITLGGLAIAIGEVVDDAIIDVENIFRRLRENQTLAKPRSVFHVVLDASLEVRSAVVYATFVVALVFLPVLTLTGLQGKFFAPLALSYVLAILASLAVALTLTPALAYLFFRKGVRQTTETRLQIWLKAVYGRVLGFVSRHPRAAMIAVAVVCLGTLRMLPSFGAEFLPQFREGHFVLQVSAAPGTSLPEMRRIGRMISLELMKNKRVATIEQQVGRAEQGEDTFGPHRCEFHIELQPSSGEEEEAIEKEIRKALEEFPGVQFELMTFLGDRIGETISGETAAVVINIFGEDLDVLDAKAGEIAEVLKTVPGASDIRIKSPPGAPRMAIRLRMDRLTQLGFHPVEVLEAIQTAYQGTVAAQTYQGSRVVDVAVMLAESERQDPEQVGGLKLRNAQGATMPLHELAEVYPATGRYAILHDGARRRQTVTCNPAGRDVTSLVADAKKQIATKVALPAGVYTVFSGAAEAQAGAQRELIIHSIIAGAGIFLLLVVVLGNWRNLLLVLANVPFALVGGILCLWLSGLFADPGEGGLSLGSLVGFVTLFGITMRNSIMMISHYEHLVREEGQPWGLETAIRGAAERLMPILMTALVTALGLLPLAIGSGEAGREIEGPMALVILGGLITSTILNLLVLPTLALRYGRFVKAASAEP